MNHWRYALFILLVWMSLWAFFTLLFIKYDVDVLTFALLLDVLIEIIIVYKMQKIYFPTQTDVIGFLIVRGCALLCLTLARYILSHDQENNMLAEVKLLSLNLAKNGIKDIMS